MRANELGVPTYEPTVSCGRYCYGGSVSWAATTYPEHTDADEVWVKGSDVAALAARLAALQVEITHASNTCAGQQQRAEIAEALLAEAEARIRGRDLVIDHAERMWDAAEARLAIAEGMLRDYRDWICSGSDSACALVDSFLSTTDSAERRETASHE